MRAKKDDTSYRRECKLTDGGKSPPDLSEDTKIIMDFIKDEFKHPENEFDSDNVKPRLEDLASERDVWRSKCWQGVLTLEEKRTQHHHEKRQRRHARMAQPRPPDPMYQCPDCNKRCASRIGLYSHRRTHM
ncbi:hypothetical protein Pmani_021999 [Petrolisthes manimaculis]|uniref:C2H2-type domain-containing protein n=1 Tax=Petrolisthes manimaculis TaxID=1843537 RepID=A0AAE1PFF5_9EUCA|nr:hypothetical protein Pmani_021999 [Petrolisthes manimaculis]